MQHTITINNQQLPIVIKNHHAAKRLVLRYSSAKACVLLTLPRRVSVNSGLKFVEKNRDWLESQLKKLAHEKENYGHADDIYVDGAQIPVLGKNITIKHIGGRGLAYAENGFLYVHGGEEFLKRRVQLWLKNKCEEAIVEHSKKFSEQLNVRINKITLRDTSSRWGSCSHSGNLSFSWRLVFAPAEVLEYVVAHEVAHMKQHNHSPAFWAVVFSICPNWQQQRKWLKTHGRMLHRF